MSIRKQNKLMKRILLLLLLGCIGLPGAYAQMGEMRNNLSVGVNAGINLNSVSFQPSVKQKNLQGINGGLTLRYISEKYFNMICGAQLELNFSQHGWDEYYEDFPDLQYTRKMNYVEIPFLAHLAFGREKGLQFFLHMGPQIGFFLSDSYTISEGWEDALSWNPNLNVEQHDKKVENKFDYGIAGGAGVELRTKAGNFVLEGRYYYALSDFYKSTKKDYFSRSAHSAISIKLAYLFDLWK